jgi:hypothetical protein
LKNKIKIVASALVVFEGFFMPVLDKIIATTRIQQAQAAINNIAT